MPYNNYFYGAIGHDSDDEEEDVDNSIHSNRQATSMVDTLRSTVQSIMIFGGENASIRQLSGQATVQSEIFNIAKNLVGSGCLSLSGGIALYADSPYAIVSACTLIATVGAIFAYYSVLQGRICRITHAYSYGESWEHTVGHSSFAVSLVIATYPALGCLGCSIILCETFASLSETINFPLSRFVCLMIITIFVLLPLCLLKNMAVLAPFSTIGVFVTVLAAVAMMIRYFDGSYNPGGIFHDDIPAKYQPMFSTRIDVFSVHVLPFLCMAFSAFVMHYNSCRFYVELKQVTVPRFTAAVGGAFALSTAIYVTMATAGYLTFGGNSDGFILNNYSPRDPLAAFCRLAIAISVLLNFPVSFIGFRDAVLDVFKIPIELQTAKNLDLLTVLLLTIVTCVAATVSDLGMVNALAGGLFGILIVFVFPTMMFRAVAKKNTLSNQDAKSSQDFADAGFATGLMVLGVIVGVVGTFVSLFVK